MPDTKAGRHGNHSGQQRSRHARPPDRWAADPPLHGQPSNSCRHRNGTTRQQGLVGPSPERLIHTLAEKGEEARKPYSQSDDAGERHGR
jgi:hypothetical protein